MFIQFTEDAVQAIRERIGERAGRLKLVYDNEGCGCAVSGVPALWIIEAATAHDFQLQAEPLDVWMDNKHEVFFEEKMTVERSTKNDRCFILKSSGQIYNSYMHVIDKRG
ncbi:iron-sulfur cluster biosynthesis family protein [Paenibacillus sp. YYML68]|uniref:iron-sulfur cluster biosynthesis family protein n=1 Tax=Paenibacillus sp. YYML68 TaxID=2909250 RepID=UPI0024916CC7|nr:iron-sulfur cluster biosynthesis family protein [Paenibacillus sp. YYML68]